MDMRMDTNPPSTIYFLDHELAKVRDGLPLIMAHVLREIVEKTTPKVPRDQGKLETTPQTEVQRLNADEVMGVVEYSALSPKGYDYALIQHEVVSFRHPKKGEAKYLDKGLKDAQVMDVINHEFKRLL